jgi:hypothetical protein
VDNPGNVAQDEVRDTCAQPTGTESARAVFLPPDVEENSLAAKPVSRYDLKERAAARRSPTN